MKKLGRLLLWLLGGAVLLTGVLLLAVNLYVQSQGVHHRIQQELSQRLDTPLRLGQISVTPWSGLKLNGITIPQEGGKQRGYFLRAQSFQLRVQFWSLFSDRLVIRQVSLINPEVVWAQNSAGKWRLPELPRPKARPAATPIAVPALPAASPSPATPSAPDGSAAQPNESPALAPAPVFTPEVQRVTLKDGDFTFLDSAGRVIARFLGLDFRSSFRTATEIKGNARVGKISLRDRFFIENLQSPLRYDPAGLAFSNISAQAAGGVMSGNFAMELQTADSPFTAQVKFRDLQAEKLMQNAGGPAGMIQGRVEGFLDAAGKTADPNALSGRGEIILRDGKLQQYSLLVALGQILQIDELPRDAYDYLAKLDRAYIDATPFDTTESRTFGSRLAAAISAAEQAVEARSRRPDVVLLDTRSGIHDVAAVALTQLSDLNLLFASDNRQTWSGYQDLFGRWAKTNKAGVIRDRLRMVAAMVPPNTQDLYLEEFGDRAQQTFAETLYDDVPAGEDSGAYNPAPEDQTAPHWPVPILFTSELIGVDISSERSWHQSEIVEAAYSEFLQMTEALIFGDSNE